MKKPRSVGNGLVKITMAAVLLASFSGVGHAIVLKSRTNSGSEFAALPFTLNAAVPTTAKFTAKKNVFNSNVFSYTGDLEFGSQNQTFFGLANKTYTFNLTSFVLYAQGNGANGQPGSVLTLSGTSTTKFVFKISKNFDITDNSQFLFTGGLLASNVTFDFKGQKAATIRNGSDFQGTFASTGGTKQNKLVISGGSSVQGTVSGPSTIAPAKPGEPPSTVSP